MFEVQLDIQEALRDGEELSGGFLDGVKHFDLFVPALARAVYMATGLDPALVNMITKMWDAQVVYVKINGHYGDPFTPLNGIGQGCSMSVMTTNLDTTIWARHIEAAVPGTKKNRLLMTEH